ncbi:MAG: YlmH/Sll1252 family protein [Oscillospiraceae bacterium]|nr:YlmH/Sll1252 family protein [Oscillospiraceae bacterium]
MADTAREKGTVRFTEFLTERLAHIAAEYIRQSSVENAALYGGYEDAARKMCGFFTDFEKPAHGAFPIAGITVAYPGDIKLSHRDFLGTLLGLGIKRGTVGDILAEDGRCAVFVTEVVSPVIMQELVTVGGAAVSCSRGIDTSALPQPRFKDISGTVGSLRMDSLVRLLTGYAREKSAAMIRSGLVKRNDNTVLSVSEGFGAGDTISVRGFGKYIIDGTGGPTKKGRLTVRARKYI